MERFSVYFFNLKHAKSLFKLKSDLGQVSLLKADKQKFLLTLL